MDTETDTELDIGKVVMRILDETDIGKITALLLEMGRISRLIEEGGHPGDYNMFCRLYRSLIESNPLGEYYVRCGLAGNTPRDLAWAKYSGVARVANWAAAECVSVYDPEKLELAATEESVARTYV